MPDYDTFIPLTRRCLNERVPSYSIIVEDEIQLDDETIMWIKRDLVRGEILEKKIYCKKENEEVFRKEE